jgi:hypothetical protein
MWVWPEETIEMGLEDVRVAGHNQHRRADLGDPVAEEVEPVQKLA